MTSDDDKKQLKVAILNDFPYHSGVTSYAYGLYQSLRLTKNEATFHQFYVGKKSYEYPEAIYHNGIKFKIPKAFELNKLIGLNVKKLSHVTSQIIHLSNPSLYKLGNMDGRKIVTIHDLFYLNGNSNSKIMSAYYRNAYFKLKGSFPAIADSNFTRNESIEKLGYEPSDIIMVWPSIDTTKFTPKPFLSEKYCDNGKKKIILHVGYDSPNKNIKMLIDTMNILPPEYELVRVGYNSPSTLKYIERQGQGGRIKLLGELNGFRLLENYKNSDIFVFPSLYEGFGIPPIEAMASGIPTIVSNKASLPEITGNAALHSELTPEAIADKILKLNDTKVAFNLYKKGIERSKLFSRSNQAEKLVNAYKSLLYL